jgi:hypothetical protein
LVADLQFIGGGKAGRFPVEILTAPLFQVRYKHSHPAGDCPDGVEET